MINLNEYDNGRTRINKQKTWYFAKQKTIVSKELKKRKYFKILKRYNTISKEYEYFLLLCDVLVQDASSVKVDDYGRIKIRLNDNEIKSFGITINEDCNLIVENLDSDNESELYSIEAE